MVHNSIFTSIASRTWNVGLLLPEMRTTGSYQLFGIIPPGLDLGRSTGAERYAFWYSSLIFEGLLADS